MPTYRELLEAQLNEWPESKILTPAQVIQWANRPSRFNRYKSVAFAIYHEHVVWYSLDDKPDPWGFRFGTKPEEYMSGFAGLGDDL
jgi:hypothetical protein